MNLLAALTRRGADRRQQAACAALATMVTAARNAPATVQYRQRRAAALKHTRQSIPEGQS